MTKNPSKFISHLLSLVICVLVTIVGISCTSEGPKALIVKAEQGDAAAQCILGWIYDFGPGVLKNSSECIYVVQCFDRKRFGESI